MMMHFVAVTTSVLLMGSVLAVAQVPAKVSLQKRLPELSIKDVALEEALAFFQEATQANWFIDWRAIEGVGVSRDTPVTVKLKFVPTHVALRAVLESAAPGLLTFETDQNVITVTARKKSDEKMFVRIYPVQDLLVEVPDFRGPVLNLTDRQTDIQNRNSQGRLFDQTSRNRDDDRSMTRSERVEQLIRLIQTTIRPDIWDTHGGKARITFFNGYLIVAAPKSVHEALGGTWD